MKQLQFAFYILLTLLFMEQTIVAQNDDWANLARYREENIILGLPSIYEDRVVFMGNSITESWSLVCPEFFNDKRYINRGISGQTTPQMLIRFRPDVINLKPKAVVLLAGTNDIAENTGPTTIKMISDNIVSMVDIARANNIKVVLCAVLPVYDYPWKTGLNPVEKIDKLNKWIRDYAHENGIVYVDYFTAMADERNGLRKEYSEDGVHPNEAGYRVMAPLVERAIKKALGK